MYAVGKREREREGGGRIPKYFATSFYDGIL